MKSVGQKKKPPFLSPSSIYSLSIPSPEQEKAHLYKRDASPSPPKKQDLPSPQIQLFDNKADHTTYFGTNPEYIQGIHMLPLLPSSAYTRSPTFISEEWSAFFGPGAFNPANTVEGGWRGVLYGNLACVDPGTAWGFFSGQEGGFDGGWIDGGASRTWYLGVSAGESVGFDEGFGLVCRETEC